MKGVMGPKQQLISQLRNYRIDDRMSCNGKQVMEIGTRQKQIEEMKQIQNQVGLTTGKVSLFGMP